MRVFLEMFDRREGLLLQMGLASSVYSCGDGTRTIRAVCVCVCVCVYVCVCRCEVENGLWDC